MRFTMHKFCQHRDTVEKICFSFARLRYVFSKKERRNKCYLSEFSGIKMIEKVRRHDLWSQLWFCGCLLPFTISFSVFTLNWSFAIRATVQKSHQSFQTSNWCMYLRERMKKYSAQSINFYWPPTKHTDAASVAYLIVEPVCHFSSGVVVFNA